MLTSEARNPNYHLEANLLGIGDSVMGAEPGLDSLFQSLKLPEPWLSPKPWESVVSESGYFKLQNPDSDEEFLVSESVYDPAIVSEAVLVRLALNALQGVKSAIISLENFSSIFCSNPADRSLHRVPNIWDRYSSMSALGKLLKSIVHSGVIVYLLEKFVDYFLGSIPNLNCYSYETRADVMGASLCQEKRGHETLRVDEIDSVMESEGKSKLVSCHSYSLVNQAFSTSVKRVLEGYICALNTLHASVQLRRSSSVDAEAHKSSIPFSEDGCLASVINSGITLLELYLHTKELRTHIEGLGAICMVKNVYPDFETASVEVLIARNSLGFQDFPIGADLLTYLFVQLRDADPVHSALLKLLFVRSCEPYCGFIRSWIYRASINDPHKEFVVECLDTSSCRSHIGTADADCSPVPSMKVRVGVSVPYFLKDICTPLFRAGQQLQVLIKLLDLLKPFPIEGSSHTDGNHSPLRMAKLMNFLPFWGCSSSDHFACSSILSFGRSDIEALISKREAMYKMMQRNLDYLFAGSNIKSRRVVSRVHVIPSSAVPGPLEHREGSAQVPVIAGNASSALDVDSDSFSISKFSDESDTVDEDAESSSLHSFDEPHMAKKFMDLHDIFVFQKSEDRLASKPLADIVDVQEANEAFNPERPWDPISSYVSASCEGNEEAEANISSAHLVQCNLNLSQLLVSDARSMSPLPKTLDINNQFLTGWFHGLPGSQFLNEGGGDYIGSYISDPMPIGTNRNFENKTERFKCNGDMPVFSDSEYEPGLRESLFENKKFEYSTDDFTPQTLPLKKNYNCMNINPILSRSSWLQMLYSSRDTKYIDKRRVPAAYFNFLSVGDLAKMYEGDSFIYEPENFDPVEISEKKDHGFSVLGMEKLDQRCEQKYGEGNKVELAFPANQISQPHLRSPADLFSHSQEPDAINGVSGGAKWETLLTYGGDDQTSPAKAKPIQNSMARSEIPLEIIIEKCIVQEILLQYQYISNFTVKLLEVEFDLREHLLALRRYHFMEVADWADTFILSLGQHRYRVEPNQRTSEIQRILDLAVQRSSCEGDAFKERLYVYLKGEEIIPPTTTITGIHDFDIIGLGYKVDWPISIVLTPDALKIYATVFSFMIQIKLAAFAVTDVWRFLKVLIPLINDNRAFGLDQQVVERFHILMLMRQQVNHFMDALQQYMQSQLLHAAWYKFLHNLDYQVKDMIDFELVHMSYLSDSLQICFLSTEMKPVRDIIDTILQCALDFRSCCIGGCHRLEFAKECPSDLLHQINFSEVVDIKEKFDKNLMKLYRLYLNSGKEDGPGLGHFWTALDYNEYTSSMLSKNAVCADLVCSG
ncbi:uncharacterized protein LOC18421549 isoform X1 [Amborella trichopoda]|uniref:uncharacterized protein LOC18421549 isoform X1 n=1 Tax=Amborella trichopoda TaxID=13333 RepID=UPI0009BD6DE4|nr:uncharacterized protein LOC18421549 isoform X1 [Amborella trichopoda]|eukprot:XP_006826357.2 uncharacterized protein LOC18421549 isoform X1 [Amborella trichopoda]